MHCDILSDMTEAFTHSITSLNDAQRKAVLSNEQHVLILAGAGSGKTRTITLRIARLIAERILRPWEILALTFTNKAAREMRERVAHLLGSEDAVLVSTFHSFGARFLRYNHAYAELPREFVIYDDKDSVQLLQRCFPGYPRATIVSWAKAISRAKDRALFPDDSLTEVSRDSDFSAVYHQYQQALHSAGAVDFGDLLLLSIRILQERSDIREKTHARYKAILVDEYQDTNYAQFVLLKLLHGETGELSVVGDDDQSIYQFRGAEIRNILDFPGLFSPCATVRLETNYRSTEEILKLATNSIANNTDRHAKQLYGVGKTGNKPQLALLSDDIQEATYCVEKIQSEYPSGSVAVLYRRNAQSRLFESQLNSAQLSYHIVGSVRFWAREEIRDLMSFFSLLLNPRDIVAFTRIVNKPSRKIGAKSITKIRALAAEKNIGLVAAMKTDTVYAGRAKDFIRVMEHLTNLLQNMDVFSKLITYILQESGLQTIYAASDAGSSKIENIEELMRVCDEYEPGAEGLQRLLEQYALDSSLDSMEDGGRIFLMTIHSTKGLEFDHVFLSGAEEGLFPSRTDPDEIEEERRLFYVACTRAKESLTISSCRFRMLHGMRESMRLSRFVEELDPDLYEYSKNTGNHGNRASTWRQHANGPVHLRSNGVKHAGKTNFWVVGTLVYHPEFGSGRVVLAEQQYGEQYIVVTFFDGRSGEFVPRYTSGLVILDD